MIVFQFLAGLQENGKRSEMSVLYHHARDEKGKSQMKRLIALFVLCVGFSAFARNHAEVGPLDPSEWADTEAVTNFAFTIPDGDMRRFRFTLDFNATPSNCVEVSFGVDADGDGNLSLDERGMSFGWDCGAWVLAGNGYCGTPDDEIGRTCAIFGAVTTNEYKHLSWLCCVAPEGMRLLEISENGISLHFPLPDPPPDWLFQTDWNAIRVAVRGVDRPGERFMVKASRVGAAIIIR